MFRVYFRCGRNRPFENVWPFYFGKHLRLISSAILIRKATRSSRRLQKDSGLFLGGCHFKSISHVELRVVLKFHSISGAVDQNVF